MSELPRRYPGTHLPSDIYLDADQRLEWPRNDPDLSEDTMRRVLEGIRALPGQDMSSAPSEPFRGWMQPPADQSTQREGLYE